MILQKLKLTDTFEILLDLHTCVAYRRKRLLEDRVRTGHETMQIEAKYVRSRKNTVWK